MLPVVYSANLTIIFESTTRFSAFVKTAFEYRCRLQHHGEVDDARVVGGLVGVAVETGGEDQGRDAGLMEYDLVGELVEQPGEVLAAVEGVVYVEADVVIAVAHVDEAPVLPAQGLFAEDYHEAGVGLVYRLEDCTYLVDVDGADDAVLSDDQVIDEVFRAGHVEFLGIEGCEDDVLVRAGFSLLHGPEHIGEVEQDGHSGGVVVGTVVDIAVQDTQMVVVSRDEHVFVRRYRARHDAYDIASDCAACRVGKKRLVETAFAERLQTVLLEMCLNIPCYPRCIPGAGGPAVIHVVCQPGHEPLLLGLVDDLLVHGVRSQRPPALLRLQGCGRQQYQCHNQCRRYYFICSCHCSVVLSGLYPIERANIRTSPEIGSILSIMNAVEKSAAWIIVLTADMLLYGGKLGLQPVLVEFGEKSTVLVLQGQVGGQVVVDVVGLYIVVNDGELAFQNCCLERIQCAVHQGYVVGLDGGADLLNLVVL